MMTLGEVGEVKSGSGFPKKHQGREGEKYPFYKVSDMNLPGNEREMVEEANSISETVRKQLRCSVFGPGSIIFPKIGGAIATNKKRVVTKPCCIDNNVMGIEPKLEIIDGEYLYYFFRFHDLSEFASDAHLPSIRKSTVVDWPIPLPPLKEQKRIVAILDEAFESIATARANAEKNLANAKELFESYLNRVFTEKGEGWEESSLGEICANLDSRRVPITKSKRKNGPIPYYGASGVVDHVANHLFDEELLLVSEDGANLLMRTYPIAFSVSGKIWVNNHAHVLRFENMATQMFTEFYLNSIRLDNFISGMAQPKLNQRSLNSIPIPIPSLAAQNTLVQKFAEMSSSSHRLKRTYIQKLTNLKELKQLILQKAFAGELT